MSQAEIITFGCRLNAFESEIMREHAATAGLRDTVIVNTCAVTGEAERQARQAIRRARRESPDARIIVTGCAAQIDAEGYAAMPEVDRVIGNAEKLAVESFKADAAPVLADDIMAARRTAAHLITGFQGRARAFVQVQNGCDHRCTFCAIPFGRGPSRSVPLGHIVSQTRQLVTKGIREIALTGVDITAYGADLPGRPRLGRMVCRLLRAVPELDRLRLGSLDVAEVDRDLRDLVANDERVMPHLHLSLQSGDDLVLKRMKRRHTRGLAIAFCRDIRALRPDIVFGTDLIAGFPTEDEGMFRRTVDLVAEAGLTYLHVFPYSPRPGTPAARMPQVAGSVRRDRAARLRALGAARTRQFLARQVGSFARVLVEKPSYGRSEHYAPVRLASRAVPGHIVRTRLLGIERDQLVGCQA